MKFLINLFFFKLTSSLNILFLVSWANCKPKRNLIRKKSRSGKKGELRKKESGGG